MPGRIDDYALIGDTETAALVGRDGSIDWLCLPRFDSPSCFSALLGSDRNGRWRIAPRDEVRRTTRRYRGESLVLETTFETESGTVRLVDCMPPRSDASDVVRVVEGVSGTVTMELDLVVRFDYGSAVPWVRRVDEGTTFVAGPDALILQTPVETKGKDFSTVGTFTVSAGERVPFVLTWYRSHLPHPYATDPWRAIEETESMWQEWSRTCTYDGPWRRQVVRSLLTLKALTFRPTGGIVAAPTTSLPESIGHERNWDYRFCWLRDATFTLYALMANGYTDEARAWRDWLLRAVAGHPTQMQIMYGPAGERRLTEEALPWLEGYEGSKPVRIGNAASGQFQLDVYGEIVDCFHQARRIGIPVGETGWAVERQLLDFLEGAWREPDEGLWEMRGPRQHFTHSKVMAWVAMDRAVRAVERYGLDGPADRWRQVRDEIRDEVHANAWDDRRGTFTQAYGSRRLDASLLMMPLVGFIDADDPRMVGTLATIERELMDDGFIRRYDTDEGLNDVDGLTGTEGAFLPCTFWYVDNLALAGRTEEAREVFERLLGLTNDVGLLAEEYDPRTKRMLGNYPQAFTHVGLVNSALALSPRTETSPAELRSDGDTS